MKNWVRPIRTSIQVLLALISASPLIVPALGLDATVGVGAVLVGSSTVLARLMAIPQVEQQLEKLGLNSPK